ncbi:WecB/TagA/CpsF family glycosyltransferase [Clostridium paraputrificum]|uniref:WecB/TagA/CpsF family glycosyltransferase n=1 Tax=Clostridium paraputrificum TaxID=29363 RepID=UPI00356A441B
MSRIKFLNIMVDNLTMNEAVVEIDKLIQNRCNSYLVTPNVDHIVRLEEDKEFQRIYQNADLILTDGMPLVWISKYLGNPIKEKVSGSDLFPKVCELANNKGYKMFLLGAAEGVAKKAACKLREKYVNIDIVGTYSPQYGFEEEIYEINKIIDIINSCRPDILVVGLGAPKQEKFIYKYKETLNVPISLALGATIDFEAGNVKRAPKWMSNNGLEWLYRLIKEPRRMFKRYIIDDLKIIKIVKKYKKL